MENILHLVDFSKNVFEQTKQLHPLHSTVISNEYLLLLPRYEYNTYSDFKLIRLSDLAEIDLYNILPKELLSNLIDVIYNETVNFISNDILAIGDYVFSCDNLFFASKNAKSTKIFQLSKSKSKPLIPLKSDYFDGYAIEIHTIKSTLKEDGSFETIRTELGESLYKLKYNFDTSTIDGIAVKCAEVINSLYANVDVLIPVPPSNLNRPFQPVYMLAKRISEITGISLDTSYIIKLPTEQIKSIAESENRVLLLERAVSLIDDRYNNKNIILFDDLFRSGDTLNVIAQKLKNEGYVSTVKVLCVTKTRTKR